MQAANDESRFYSASSTCDAKVNFNYDDHNAAHSHKIYIGFEKKKGKSELTQATDDHELFISANQPEVGFLKGKVWTLL